MANEIILGQGLDALNTNKIINLPNGTDPGDSVNFSQLSALMGGVTYIGPYNSQTNSPDLVIPAVGTVLKGYMYKVDTAGSAFYGVNLEVGDTVIANTDNPSVVTDWTVLQNNITVPVYTRVYFVSQEVGDDTNSGLSEFSQFATLNKALTVANAALPAASNSDRILVRITDSKSYDFGAGAVTLNGFINVHAPEARLTGNGTTPTVLSATFNSLEFGSIDGTDLTIKQVSGSGFGGILLRSPSIFNANNLINILTADGASGDAISVEAQNISCIGTFATTDTGELYINGQLGTLSVNDAADIPFVTCSGASTAAHLSISDLDGSNSGAGNVIGAESLAGAKIFARVGCNTLDIPWKADGAGSEIHAFGDIDNAPIESTSGIVYRNTQTEGVYFPNLPSTGGLALTDLIKISKAGVAEKATLADLQTLLDTLFVTLGTNQTITGQKTFQSLRIEDMSVGTTSALLLVRDDALGSFTFGAQSSGDNDVLFRLIRGAAGGTMEMRMDNAGAFLFTPLQAGTIVFNSSNNDVDTKIEGSTGVVLWVDGAQENVSIGGLIPNAVAILDLQSTDKGFLPPRMTAVQASAITPVDGLILYTTDTDATFTTVGLWLYEDGAWKAVTSIGSGGTTATAKVANYTAVANDFVLMTTGATDKTVTLPAAAANTNAVIEVKKVDSGAGNVIIDGNGAETIDGLTTQTILSQYTSITLHCDGTEWWIK